MVFSNTTNNSGLIQDCEFWLFSADYGQISGNTNRLQTFTNLINRAYDKTAGDLLNSDTRWQWDDSRYTTYPIATQSLTADQKDYTFDDSFLKIISVEVKDANGDFYPLIPIDQADIRRSGVAETEWHETSGKPRYYDKRANALFLYPAPSSTDTTLASGLKVYFQREPKYFTTSDTTAEPGFARIFHRILSLRASYDYAVSNNMTQKVVTIGGEKEKIERDLIDFMSRREKDDVLKLTVRATPSY